MLVVNIDKARFSCFWLSCSFVFMSFKQFWISSMKSVSFLAFSVSESEISGNWF